MCSFKLRFDVKRCELVEFQHGATLYKFAYYYYYQQIYQAGFEDTMELNNVQVVPDFQTTIFTMNVSWCYISFLTFFTPQQIVRGVVITYVYLCVILCVCSQDCTRTNCCILIKFSQDLYKSLLESQVGIWVICYFKGLRCLEKVRNNFINSLHNMYEIVAPKCCCYMFAEMSI